MLINRIILDNKILIIIYYKPSYNKPSNNKSNINKRI